jgi:hypothetical protein
MRTGYAIGLAVGLSSLAPALAAPARFESMPGTSLVSVRLLCNPSRCIDPDTGAYTYSNCNYRGCYRSSGIVGYTNPGYSRDYGRYERPRGYGYGRRWRRDYYDE